jgi:hypothetical protein
VKSLKYILFFICFQSVGQQLINPLPIVKNGRWYLFDGVNEIQLPATYTYINTFDEQGTAFYSEGNNHGVIDKHGNEITKSIYKEIEQIGNGIYKQSTFDGYELFTSDKLTSILCNWSKKIDDNWLVYFYDTTSYLLNTNWNQGMPIKSTFDIQKSILNYLILQTSKNYYKLYDPKGNLIDSSDALVKINDNNFYYKGSRQHIYLDVNGKWDVPKNVKNFIIYENTIKISIDNKTKIIFKNSKKTLIEAICDNIEKDGDNFKIIKGNTQGLIDKNGKVLIPPIYEVFFKIPNGFYVYKNQLKGFMNLNYKEKIPCQFKEIYFDEKFIFTESYLGNKGLINRITYEEILPAYYTKINIEEGMIKAYGKDKLVIMQLNENLTIKNKVILDHVVTLNSPLNTSKFDFDRRLLSIGWYFDTMSVFDKNHNWVKTDLRWGIKNNQDSILLKSSIRNPKFIENAPITIVKSGVSDLKLFNNCYVQKEVNFYTLYNHEIGKKAISPAVFDIDTSDFINHDFARFLHQNGQGFYFRDHTFKLVNYIEPGENEFIRYCNFSASEKLSTTSKSKTAITIDDVYFNNRIIFRNANSFEFKDAKWNYMNKNGDSLFKEPFDFVSNFYINTAIVKDKKGWGLITKDSIILPTIFSKIERIKEFGDTLFKVQLVQKGKLYLDSTLTQTQFENFQLEKSNSKLSLFSKKAEFIIIDSNNHILKTSTSIPKLKENGYFIIKDKKQRVVFDSDGNELISMTYTPIEILKNGSFIVEHQNKYGLISISGDTILTISYNELINTGNYIIAKKEGITYLLSDKLNEIKKIKSGYFLIDLATQNWLIIDFPKIQIFSSDGIKITSWKIEEKIINFYNNHIYTSKGNLYTVNGIKIENNIEFKDFKTFEDGYIALEDNENKWHLFNSMWELISDDQLKNRSISYHGDHVFSIITKNGLMVYDFLNKKQFDQFTEINGNFKDEYISVTKGEYTFYIDRYFKDVFNRHYKSTTEFKNGLASIEDEKGWSIIGENGLTKTLPSFPEIKQINANLFETSKLPLYGVYNSNGIAIIEPIYEKITIVDKKLFQVIKNGEIHYFDLNGKKIY